jgi:uncharacterized protein YegL
MSRRLPIYLLLDTSGSMLGEPIESVKTGVGMLLSSLRQDPQALETAHLSVITFDSSAKQVVSLTELADFQQPVIKAEGVTVMGSALRLVAECCDREIRKSTEEVRGDWKPLVFLMTDGRPSDERDFQAGLAEFQKRKWGLVVACAAGADADANLLKQITENVVVLATADQASIKAFFKWVSASILSASASVANGIDVSKGDQLPPPPAEIVMAV